MLLKELREKGAMRKDAGRCGDVREGACGGRRKESEERGDRGEGSWERGKRVWSKAIWRGARRRGVRESMES